MGLIIHITIDKKLNENELKKFLNRLMELKINPKLSSYVKDKEWTHYPKKVDDSILDAFKKCDYISIDLSHSKNHPRFKTRENFDFILGVGNNFVIQWEPAHMRQGVTQTQREFFEFIMEFFKGAHSIFKVEHDLVKEGKMSKEFIDAVYKEFEKFKDD